MRYTLEEEEPEKPEEEGFEETNGDILS